MTKVMSIMTIAGELQSGDDDFDKCVAMGGDCSLSPDAPPHCRRFAP